MIQRVLIAISFILISSIANAACLNGHPSITEEYTNSQSVFICKVLAENAVPESDNYYDGQNYTVQVQEVFKGNPASTVVIFSENSSGRFPMSAGSIYILFVYYEFGRYQIDNCGNSGLLPEKQDVVQAVRQLKQNKDGTNKPKIR
jgi:hypothetical protein